eukprot:g3806.t1
MKKKKKKTKKEGSGGETTASMLKFGAGFEAVLLNSQGTLSVEETFRVSSVEVAWGCVALSIVYLHSQQKLEDTRSTSNLCRLYLHHGTEQRK